MLWLFPLTEIRNRFDVLIPLREIDVRSALFQVLGIDLTQIQGLPRTRSLLGAQAD